MTLNAFSGDFKGVGTPQLGRESGIHRTYWVRIVNGQAREEDQTACKPGSVRPCERDGHSSGPAVADRFSRPTRIPGPATALPACADAGSLFGLAPGGACHAASVASGPVRSYRTLSPLPLPKERRSALCGAIPGVTPGGRYPPPCRRGARTFLEPCGPRPPGRLIRADKWSLGCVRSTISPWRGRPRRCRRSAARGP
jgi:hypothetical protein